MKRKTADLNRNRKKTRRDPEASETGGLDTTLGTPGLTTPLTTDGLLSQKGMDLDRATPQPLRGPSQPPTAVDQPAEIEDILESPDATRVGVQLVLRSGRVGDLLVAGRPASPFTGTMGDHVTAFGVHVVNLRRAMQGKDLRGARKGITDLVESMKALPGYKLIKGDDSDWRRRLAALEAAVRERPGGSEDDEVAALQRIAALYLEVREGIPLSLLNTRSLTADAGKGRGEAKWLPRLADDGEPQKQTKRRRLSGAGATAEQIEIALGLFDQDASAMLTFNHDTNQEGHVASLLPAHTDIAAVLRTDLSALTGMMARQHAMSLFPNASEEELQGIAKAVAKELVLAHKARAQTDGDEWKRRLERTLERMILAVNKIETLANWLKLQSGTPEQLESALRDVGLLTAGAPEEFRARLKPLYASVPSAVERVWDVASMPNHPDRASLVSAIRTFLRQFHENMEQIKVLEPAMLSQEELKKTEAALRKLQEATDAASVIPDVAVPGPKVLDSLLDSGSQASLGLPPKKRLLDDSPPADFEKDRGSVVTEPRRRLVVPRSQGVFGAAGSVGPRVASTQEREAARAVLGELSTGTGNSFTVALRLGSDRRIESVGLRGRTPSPFKGTMGAHATAWVVWVRAVENLVKDATIADAGKNLVEFAAGIIANAEGQPNLPNIAQNGQRRSAARWGEGSLDAWRMVLKEHEANPWTASSVQAYAQAVLTFVNMLPGTTRTGKNTDGHAEAKAWSEAKQNYASGSAEARSWAIEGAGLFDAGPNAWVKPRHLALMGVALGGRQSDAWKAWPGRT